MENTIFSLIPAVVALVLVLTTRKVLLSLGIGSISAALLLADFNPMEAVTILVDAIKSLFYVDGAW
ncbi:MAG: Na+/H+ antiporter NhaC family protein, partial [Bacillus sp. (in: firmicutes)]